MNWPSPLGYVSFRPLAFAESRSPKPTFLGPQYTKDLVIEETSSGSNPGSPSLLSPCAPSVSTSPLPAPPSEEEESAAAQASQHLFSLPLPRGILGPSMLRKEQQRRRLAAERKRERSRGSHKRKRSVSDSLVLRASKGAQEEHEEADVCVYDDDTLCATEELDNEEQEEDEDLRLGETVVHRPEHNSDVDKEEASGIVESGDDGEDDGSHSVEADDDGGGSSQGVQRLAGHESGPPSPPFQHGSTIPFFLLLL